MSIFGRYKTPRCEERYDVRVPVTLRVGRRVRKLYSSDVSFRGLFICTDDPPVLRQLIRVELELLPDHLRFESHAMSVYVLPPGQAGDRGPGVGVQFYAQSETERRKWERFVTYVKDKPIELPPDAIDPVKRMHPRIDARFEVHPRDINELQVIYSRDISNGGMFLETDMPLDVGCTLALTIFHPLTRQTFTIDAVVRRRSSEDPAGLGVEFTCLDPARFARFCGFVRDGLAALAEIDDVEAEPT